MQADATSTATVPLTLTNDRSAQGIINMIQGAYGTTIAASQISPVAAGMLQRQASQWPVSDSQRSNHRSRHSSRAWLRRDRARSQRALHVDQGIANVDYVVSEQDRLGVKYYIQDNPTTNPFGSVGDLLGFPQQLSAGSQVGSINNTVILTPNLTWEQRIGFTRLRAFAATSQAFTPSQFGINLLGSTAFPQLKSATPTRR